MNTPVVMSRQFAEDAATLWWRRDSAYLDDNCTLHELVRLDGQIDALLDGLLIHGSAGSDAALLQLENVGSTDDASADAFCALTLALLRQDHDLLNAILRSIWHSTPLCASIGDATAWVATDYARDLSMWCLQRDEPQLLAAGLKGLASMMGDISRISIPTRRLRELINHSDPNVQLQAITLGAKWRIIDLADNFIELSRLGTISAELDFALQRALVLVAPQHASIDRLWALARSGQDCSDSALQLLGAAMPACATSTVDDGHGRKDSETLTLAYARYLGSTSYVDYAAALLQSPFQDKALKALQAITGYPIETRGEEADQSALFSKWWGKNQSRFDAQRRYLFGQEITDEALQQALISLPQAHRDCAAIRRCIRNPKVALFATRAPARVQRAALANIKVGG